METDRRGELGGEKAVMLGQAGKQAAAALAEIERTRWHAALDVVLR